jgi:hypothetical protein
MISLPQRTNLPVSARTAAILPSVIAKAGERAVRRFLEFFAATIRNKNTRIRSKSGTIVNPRFGNCCHQSSVDFA